MRYKKVFLVSLHTSTYFGSMRPPTGIGYLSEKLTAKGIDHQVMDLRLATADPLQPVRQVIESFKPDLVGFAVYTYAHKKSYDFIAEVKAIAGGAHVIVGGPHVSTAREEFLKAVPAVDYGCVLEGEELLYELCQGVPLAEIRGLFYRESGAIKYTGDRPFVIDLDEVAWPKYEKLNLDDYIGEKGLISSRGCPYKCTYCSVHATTGKRFRMRSAKNIVDEIEYWHKRGIRQFNFLDDNFTLVERRVYEFCDELEKRGLTQGLILRATNGVRADRLDRKMLSRMKDIGFKSLLIGVESASPRVLELIKKGETFDDIKNAVVEACDLGYDVWLSFIYGIPGETVEDIEESVKFAKSVPVTGVSFNNLIPYPKTEVYRWIEENNRFLIKPEQYLNHMDKHEKEPTFDTDELPRKTRIWLHDYLRKVEKDVKAKRVARILERYYPLNLLAAKAFNWGIVQYLVRNSLVTRKILEKVRVRLMYSN